MRITKHILEFLLSIKCKILSFDNTHIHCDLRQKIFQTAVYRGHGHIYIAKGAIIGCNPGPEWFSANRYLEARKETSYIKIGNSIFNNYLYMISEADEEAGGIEIGDYCMFGANVSIFDSNFHGVEPENRRESKAIKTGKVVIENNVWVGDKVTILKGVRIGENSVIQAHSLVIKDIPKNCMAGGIPAKVIRYF